MSNILNPNALCAPWSTPRVVVSHSHLSDRNAAPTLKVLQALREAYPKMSLQMACIFLLVAQTRRLGQADIMRICRMGQSSTSRNVSALCKFDRKGKPGLNLIKREVDLMDTRMRWIVLSQKGEALSRSLEAATLSTNFTVTTIVDI